MSDFPCWIVEPVSEANLTQAAELHAVSWRDSHRAVCAPEFLAAHTTERQRSYLQKKLESGSRIFLLTDKFPVGLVAVTGNLIEDLYVHPDCQCKGYGTALVRYAIRECAGIPTLWLLETNVRAGRLYERLGFRPTGRINRDNGPLAEIAYSLQADDNGGKAAMLIRTATGEEMLELWGYPEREKASPTARFFYENIAAGNALFWTLDCGGELIGELYAFLDIEEDKDFADGRTAAYLCAFRVKPAYRGQGLGSGLMEAALADLKKKGFRRATIGVDEARNERLYRRMGFTAEIKTCYVDPCARDKSMRPERDEAGYLLLAKEL